MQHIPSVNSEDVERIIKRDFPPDCQDEIRHILSAYGRDTFHQEINRVRLAVLKLASGKIDQLRREVENACCDYRDTLLVAEYPAYGRMMLKIDSLSPKERKKITDSDRDQYEEWLHRTLST